jgi:hypothetical protein
VALAELLLCLTGQTDTEFELLLVGHKLSEERQATVERIIAETPTWLQQRVRFIEVDEGNRTRPLSVGFAAAQGSYVSILDDDDLVFDNWVHTFHELALASPGKLAHAYCVVQDWERVSDAHGRVGLRAVAPADDLYCRPFDYLDQLATNYCPTMSYAVPIEAYQQAGILFDETLTTNEDWDFLMRVVAHCGVSDSEAVTSIYRNWINAENSHQVHANDEWESNYRRIRDKFMAAPLTLPPGYTDQIAELVLANKLGRTALLPVERAPELVVGKPDAPARLRGERSLSGRREWTFSGFPEQPTTSVHLLPTRHSGVSVANLTITITTADDKRRTFRASDVKSNGVREGGSLHFLGVAPDITVRLRPGRTIRTLTVSYLMTSPVNKNVVKVLELFSWHRILAYRLAKKLLGAVRGR